MFNSLRLFWTRKRLLTGTPKKQRGALEQMLFGDRKVGERPNRIKYDHSNDPVGNDLDEKVANAIADYTKRLGFPPKVIEFSWFYINHNLVPFVGGLKVVESQFLTVGEFALAQ